MLRARHPQQHIAHLRERLVQLQQRPQALIAQRLQREALHLRGLARSLHAISPLATVARGYSILQQEHGRIVRKADDTQPGDTLHARISDGQLRLQVLDVRYTT